MLLSLFFSRTLTTRIFVEVAEINFSAFLHRFVAIAKNHFPYGTNTGADLEFFFPFTGAKK